MSSSPRPMHGTEMNSTHVEISDSPRSRTSTDDSPRQEVNSNQGLSTPVRKTKARHLAQTPSQGSHTLSTSIQHGVDKLSSNHTFQSGGHSGSHHAGAATSGGGLRSGASTPILTSTPVSTLHGEPSNRLILRTNPQLLPTSTGGSQSNSTIHPIKTFSPSSSTRRSSHTASNMTLSTPSGTIDTLHGRQSPNLHVASNPASSTGSTPSIGALQSSPGLHSSVNQGFFSSYPNTFSFQPSSRNTTTPTINPNININASKGGYHSNHTHEDTPEPLSILQYHDISHKRSYNNPEDPQPLSQPDDPCLIPYPIPLKSGYPSSLLSVDDDDDASESNNPEITTNTQLLSPQGLFNAQSSNDTSIRLSEGLNGIQTRLVTSSSLHPEASPHLNNLKMSTSRQPSSSSIQHEAALHPTLSLDSMKDPTILSNGDTGDLRSSQSGSQPQDPSGDGHHYPTSINASENMSFPGQGQLHKNNGIITTADTSNYTNYRNNQIYTPLNSHYPSNPIFDDFDAVFIMTRKHNIFNPVATPSTPYTTTADPDRRVDGSHAPCGIAATPSHQLDTIDAESNEGRDDEDDGDGQMIETSQLKRKRVTFQDDDDDDTSDDAASSQAPSNLQQSPVEDSLTLAQFLDSSSDSSSLSFSESSSSNSDTFSHTETDLEGVSSGESNSNARPGSLSASSLSLVRSLSNASKILQSRLPAHQSPADMIYTAVSFFSGHPVGSNSQPDTPSTSLFNLSAKHKAQRKVKGKGSSHRYSYQNTLRNINPSNHTTLGLIAVAAIILVLLGIFIFLLMAIYSTPVFTLLLTSYCLVLSLFVMTEGDRQWFWHRELQAETTFWCIMSVSLAMIVLFPNDSPLPLLLFDLPIWLKITIVIIVFVLTLINENRNNYELLRRTPHLLRHTEVDTSTSIDKLHNLQDKVSSLGYFPSSFILHSSSLRKLQMSILNDFKSFTTTELNYIVSNIDLAWLLHKFVEDFLLETSQVFEESISQFKANAIQQFYTQYHHQFYPLQLLVSLKQPSDPSQQKSLLPGGPFPPKDLVQQAIKVVQAHQQQQKLQDDPVATVTVESNTPSKRPKSALSIDNTSSKQQVQQPLDLPTLHQLYLIELERLFPATLGFRSALLAFLCIFKASELDVISKACIIDAMQNIRLTNHFSQLLLAQLLLQTYGEDLTSLKCEIDGKNTIHSLHKLLWDDISDNYLRWKLVCHFQMQGVILENLRHEHGLQPRQWDTVYLVPPSPTAAIHSITSSSSSSFPTTSTQHVGHPSTSAHMSMDTTTSQQQQTRGLSRAPEHIPIYNVTRRQPTQANSQVQVVPLPSSVITALSHEYEICQKLQTLSTSLLGDHDHDSGKPHGQYLSDSQSAHQIAPNNILHGYSSLIYTDENKPISVLTNPIVPPLPQRQFVSTSDGLSNPLILQNQFLHHPSEFGEGNGLLPRDVTAYQDGGLPEYHTDTPLSTTVAVDYSTTGIGEDATSSAHLALVSTPNARTVAATNTSIGFSNPIPLLFDMISEKSATLRSTLENSFYNAASSIDSNESQSGGSISRYESHSPVPGGDDSESDQLHNNSNEQSADQQASPDYNTSEATRPQGKEHDAYPSTITPLSSAYYQEKLRHLQGNPQQHAMVVDRQQPQNQQIPTTTLRRSMSPGASIPRSTSQSQLHRIFQQHPQQYYHLDDSHYNYGTSRITPIPGNMATPTYAAQHLPYYDRSQHYAPQLYAHAQGRHHQAQQQQPQQSTTQDREITTIIPGNYPLDTVMPSVSHHGPYSLLPTLQGQQPPSQQPFQSTEFHGAMGHPQHVLTSPLSFASHLPTQLHGGSQFQYHPQGLQPQRQHQQQRIDGGYPHTTTTTLYTTDMNSFSNNASHPSISNLMSVSNYGTSPLISAHMPGSPGGVMQAVGSHMNSPLGGAVTTPARGGGRNVTSPLLLSKTLSGGAGVADSGTAYHGHGHPASMLNDPSTTYLNEPLRHEHPYDLMPRPISGMPTLQTGLDQHGGYTAPLIGRPLCINLYEIPICLWRGGLPMEKPLPNSFHIHVNKGNLRKILMDVDDTLFSSGGVFPAGVDRIYKKHQLYPGVLSVIKELDLGWDHTGIWSPLLGKGNIALLSARPHVYKDALEKKSYGLLESLRLDYNLHAVPTLLAGNIESGIRMFVGNYEKMGEKKALNFLQYAMLYPEYHYIFIGDNGQADVYASELVKQQLGSRLELCLIHRVQPLKQTLHWTPSKEKDWRALNIYFFETYVHAAVIACAKAITHPSSIIRVINDAKHDFYAVHDTHVKSNYHVIRLDEIADDDDAAGLYHQPHGGDNDDDNSETSENSYDDENDDDDDDSDSDENSRDQQHYYRHHRRHTDQHVEYDAIVPTSDYHESIPLTDYEDDCSDDCDGHRLKQNSVKTASHHRSQQDQLLVDDRQSFKSYDQHRLRKPLGSLGLRKRSRRNGDDSGMKTLDIYNISDLVDSEQDSDNNSNHDDNDDDDDDLLYPRDHRNHMSSNQSSSSVQLSKFKTTRKKTSSYKRNRHDHSLPTTPSDLAIITTNTEQLSASDFDASTQNDDASVMSSPKPMDKQKKSKHRSKTPTSTPVKSTKSPFTKSSSAVSIASSLHKYKYNPTSNHDGGRYNAFTLTRQPLDRELHRKQLNNDILIAQSFLALPQVQWELYYNEGTYLGETLDPNHVLAPYQALINQRFEQALQYAYSVGWTSLTESLAVKEYYTRRHQCQDSTSSSITLADVAAQIQPISAKEAIMHYITTFLKPQLPLHPRGVSDPPTHDSIATVMKNYGGLFINALRIGRSSVIFPYIDPKVIASRIEALRTVPSNAVVVHSNQRQLGVLLVGNHNSMDNTYECINITNRRLNERITSISHLEWIVKQQEIIIERDMYQYNYYQQIFQRRADHDQQSQLYRNYLQHQQQHQHQQQQQQSTNSMVPPPPSLLVSKSDTNLPSSTVQPIDDTVSEPSPETSPPPQDKAIDLDTLPDIMSPDTVDLQTPPLDPDGPVGEQHKTAQPPLDSTITQDNQPRSSLTPLVVESQSSFGSQVDDQHHGEPGIQAPAATQLALGNETTATVLTTSPGDEQRTPMTTTTPATLATPSPQPSTNLFSRLFSVTGAFTQNTPPAPVPPPEPYLEDHPPSFGTVPMTLTSNMGDKHLLEQIYRHYQTRKRIEDRLGVYASTTFTGYYDPPSKLTTQPPIVLSHPKWAMSSLSSSSSRTTGRRPSQPQLNSISIKPTKTGQYLIQHNVPTDVLISPPSQHPVSTTTNTTHMGGDPTRLKQDMGIHTTDGGVLPLSLTPATTPIPVISNTRSYSNPITNTVPAPLPVIPPPSHFTTGEATSKPDLVNPAMLHTDTSTKIENQPPHTSLVVPLQLPSATSVVSVSPNTPKFSEPGISTPKLLSSPATPGTLLLPFSKPPLPTPYGPGSHAGSGSTNHPLDRSPNNFVIPQTLNVRDLYPKFHNITAMQQQEEKVNATEPFVPALLHKKPPTFKLSSTGYHLYKPLCACPHCIRRMKQQSVVTTTPAPIPSQPPQVKYPVYPGMMSSHIPEESLILHERIALVGDRVVCAFGTGVIVSMRSDKFYVVRIINQLPNSYRRQVPIQKRVYNSTLSTNGGGDSTMGSNVHLTPASGATQSSKIVPPLTTKPDHPVDQSSINTTNSPPLSPSTHQETPSNSPTDGQHQVGQEDQDIIQPQVDEQNDSNVISSSIVDSLIGTDHQLIRRSSHAELVIPDNITNTITADLLTTDIDTGNTEFEVNPDQSTSLIANLPEDKTIPIQPQHTMQQSSSDDVHNKHASASAHATATAIISQTAGLSSPKQPPHQNHQQHFHHGHHLDFNSKDFKNPFKHIPSTMLVTLRQIDFDFILACKGDTAYTRYGEGVVLEYRVYDQRYVVQYPWGYAILDCDHIYSRDIESGTSRCEIM